MKYSKMLAVFFCSLLLVSCSSSVVVNKLGKVNMLSNRNVDSKSDYVALRNYMGMSEKEIKQTKSTSIEDAIDVTVKNTPGGEFLKNVKMYQVIRDQKYYYAVEGDVWGLPKTLIIEALKLEIEFSGQRCFQKRQVLSRI